MTQLFARDSCTTHFYNGDATDSTGVVELELRAGGIVLVINVKLNITGKQNNNLAFAA